MAVAKTSVTWQCKLLSESRTGWCLEMDTLGGVIWHTKPVKCISIEQTQVQLSLNRFSAVNLLLEGTVGDIKLIDHRDIVFVYSPHEQLRYLLHL